MSAGPDFWTNSIEIAVVGLFSGLLAGAFGVGGGIIAVPLARQVLGLSAHEAVGSTLAMILPTALIGVFNYLKQGKLVTNLAFISSLPAIAGTIVASALSSYVQGKILMMLLAALMILVGLDFMLGLGNKLKESGAKNAERESVKKSRGEESRAEESRAEGLSGGEAEALEKKHSDEFSADKYDLTAKKKMIAVLIGLFVGVLSGLLGIGGGFIMVPAFCYLLNLPLKVAFGTSLVVVAMVALPGTVVHALNGHVLLYVVLLLLAGSLPGAWLGSYISLRAKVRSLRMVFGLIVLIMAFLFAYREFSLPPQA